MKYYAYIDLYDTTVRGCEDGKSSLDLTFREAKKEAIESMQSTILELNRQIKYLRIMRKKDITEIYSPY